MLSTRPESHAPDPLQRSAGLIRIPSPLHPGSGRSVRGCAGSLLATARGPLHVAIRRRL